MLEFMQPDFSLASVHVIEDNNCIQNWQLNDFTKELMGSEWVKQFDSWAAHALPKQPACYMLGEYKMIVHPSISQAIRKEVEARSKIRWNLAYGLEIRRSPNYIMACCVA